MKAPALTIVKNYFAQNAQQHVISCLRLSIALGVIRRGSAVLDPIMFQDFSNILVNKRSAIITNDFMGYAKPCDNVLMYELATAAPIALRRGMASTHLEKYSVATKIQMYPPEGGLIGPMRSSP